jgi:glutaredoxin 1
MITIYGKPSCGFCTKAKRFCEDRSFAYEYKDVTTSTFMEELKEVYPEARSVPQIFINGDRVGGYNELLSYVEETGYTGTGDSL